MKYASKLIDQRCLIRTELVKSQMNKSGVMGMYYCDTDTSSGNIRRTERERERAEQGTIKEDTCEVFAKDKAGAKRFW